MTPRLPISPWRRARNFRRAWTIVFQAQALEHLWLRLGEERQKLRQIGRILTVVVVG